jgi:hypothetical protein
MLTVLEKLIIMGFSEDQARYIMNVAALANVSSIRFADVLIKFDSRPPSEWDWVGILSNQEKEEKQC